MKNLGKQQTKQDFKGGDKERIKELEDALRDIIESSYRYGAKELMLKINDAEKVLYNNNQDI